MPDCKKNGSYITYRVSSSSFLDASTALRDSSVHTHTDPDCGPVKQALSTRLHDLDTLSPEQSIGALSNGNFSVNLL